MDEDKYKARRKKAMADRGLTNTDLMERWNCAASTVSELIGGRLRSAKKEHDFAELVGRTHRWLFPPAAFVRRRDLLPSPAEIDDD